ncbi:phosphate transport regulator, putative [Babesia ovis]|uniref:Phosphate transport regulator, putative n=1 Tax=Babesia ovis TaxID=5869 RepID=A0A9W5TCF8_BABOV|nr:phosphate transport regulator, putative [Babesia ovis]
MIQLSKQLVINLSKYQSAMTYAESLQSIRGDKNATQLDKSSSDCEGGGPRQSCEIDGMLSGEEHQLNRTIFVGPDGGHKSTLKDIQDKHVDDTKITQHLAVIHRAYSYFGHYDKPLFDLLFKLMASQHQRFKPIEVVMVANSMAKSKLHDEQVIRLFGEIIIKRRKQFTMEMVAIFLNGICMPSGNDQAMFAKILSNMMQRKYQGVITGKNCLTALQVLSKVKLKDDTLTQYFIHSLLEFINDLNSLVRSELLQSNHIQDLANAVSYITKLCPQCEQVEHLVKRYMEIYDKNDIIKNAQHVSILFYALSRTSQGFFEKYCRQLIVLLENIPSELYEPIHVTNILKAMTTLDLRNVKHISEFSRYTENNMSKFNPQLLSSTLESLYNVGGITEALWLAFCKHVNRIKKASLCDHICYLYVLTMEASAERLNDIGRKYDFLAALDTTIRGIRDSCSNLTTNSPVMFKLKDSIKQFATLRDLFGSDDSEIVESVIEMDETLANIIEGTVKS